jgi:hypothetical protein
MQACSLLLECSWEYDTDTLHHGRTNTYTLMHKGKKIVLLPLTPAKIIKYDKELAEISNNDHAFDSSGVTSKDSTMTGGALLAKTSLNAENFVDGAPCHTMLCRHISFHMILLLCLANCVLLSLTFCSSLMVGWSRG